MVLFGITNIGENTMAVTLYLIKIYSFFLLKHADLRCKRGLFGAITNKKMWHRVTQSMPQKRTEKIRDHMKIPTG
jgi:hypothetical protein